MVAHADKLMQTWREYLLNEDRAAKLQREIWRMNGVSYTAYRSFLENQGRRREAGTQAPDSQPEFHAANIKVPDLSGSLDTASPAKVSLASSRAYDHGPAHAIDRPAHSSINLANIPATVKYSFEGMCALWDASPSAITAMSWATVRADMLALANSDGDIWRIQLPAAAAAAAAAHASITGSSLPHAAAAAGSSSRSGTHAPSLAAAQLEVHKFPRRIHGGAVVWLAWSYDNSQIFTAGLDGALCVWRAADGTCMRSIACVRTRLMCGRLLPSNPSLALVGTSHGTIELHNCSAGTVCGRYKLPVSFFSAAVQATALEAGPHHVFVGDSSGVLHVYRSEASTQHMPKLVHCSSVRLQLPGLLQLQDQALTPHTQPSSSSHSSYSALSNTTIPYHGGSSSSTTSTSVERQPVVRVQGEERLRSQVSAAPAVAAPARGGVSGLQWVSFCRATHTPALLATLNDGSVCVLRLREDNHSMELHLRVAAGCDLSPPPRQQQPQDTRAAGLQVPSTAIRSLAVSLCPLSTIQAAMPCIAVGGADGSVAIYDLSTPVLQAASGHVAASLSAAVVPRLYTSGQQGRRAMGASAGGAGMGVHAAAPGVYAVSVLHGHHACVAAVGWCYDESLLASVDAGGTLIVWRRTALF